MSSSVDRRIVAMKFDNQQFEAGAAKTIQTLGELDKSLKFKDAGKGFDEITKGAKGVDLSSLADAVQTVADKFTLFGQIGMQVISRMAGAIVDFGQKMVREFAIEPIAQGWEEYNLKLDSVQVMMNSTGESLETVNRYLEDLNTYADKTIYSFSDMTASIGKFTNAGVGLEDAVKAIQGISNEAALSGANAQQASHAMYNFAQALSSGAVKLIDWKSIENANMATVEFKQQLIDTAVELGTLVKEGDRYVSTTTDMNGHVSDAFTAVSMFNDSLSAQWMTTDVLVKTLGEYADETTDIGKKAFAAAQDVKTFGQLLDTTKEAIGSGWGQTFELIVGDFEESKKLWTAVSQVIGNFVDEQSDARNEMLKTWREMGGRDSLINALSNAFQGLFSVMQPIAKAWEAVFPPITAAKLADLTKKFEAFTEKLKLSSENQMYLQKAMKGLFAAVDILIEPIRKVASALGSLFGKIDLGGNSILKFLAKVGDYIFKVNEMRKTTGSFLQAISYYTSFFDPLIEKFNNFKERMVDAFSAFTGIDTSAMEGIGARIQARLEPLTHIPEKIGAAFDKLKEKIAGFLPSMEEIRLAIHDLATVIGSGFGSLVQKMQPIFNGFSEFLSNFIKSIPNGIKWVSDHLVEIINGLNDVNFSGLFDLVNAGLFSTMLANINGFFKGLKGAGDQLKEEGFFGPLKKLFEGLTKIGGENAKRITDGIIGVLDGVKGSMEAWQKDIKANALLKIAGAMAILVGSIIALSLVDSEKLAPALAGITTLFGEMFGSLAIFEKTLGNEDLSGNLGKVTTAMIKMSVAVGILTLSVKSLAELSWEQLAIGLTGLTVIIGEMVGSVILLDKFGGDISKIATSLIPLSIAIKIMVSAVSTLASIPVEGLGAGLVGLTVILGEIVAFVAILDKTSKNMGKVATGLIPMATGVLILSKAVEVFGSMPIEAMLQGLVGMGILLTELAAFVQVTGDAKKVTSTAVGLTILGAAMHIFAAAIEKIGSMDPQTLAVGLLGLAAALAIVIVALNAIPKGILVSATGLVVLGAALSILAGVLAKLGEMSLESVVTALVALGGSLTILAVAMNAMNSATSGALALTAVALALTLFLPVLTTLGNMNFEQIINGFMALAVTFGAIYVAGMLLGPLTPVLLGLAGAIALFGAGLALIGVGALTTAAALSALSVSTDVLVASIVALVVGIAGTIPVLAYELGAGIVAIFKAVADAMPEMINALREIANAVIVLLVELTPQLVDALLNLLGQLLDQIALYLPKFWDAGFRLIEGLLQTLADHIGEIVEAGADVIINFLEGIASKIPEIIQAGVDVIISFIEGIAGAIALPANTQRLIDAVLEVGKSIITGLVNGVTGGVELVKDAFLGVGRKALDAIKGFFGIHSPSKEMAEIGEYVTQGFVEGVGSEEGSTVSAANSLADAVLKALESRYQDFVRAGSNNLQGYTKGLRDKFPEALSAIRSFMQSCVGQINSAYSQFYSAGAYVGKGLAAGLESQARAVAAAAAKLAAAAASATKSTLKVKSPSKVAEEIGMYYDEGFAQGITKYAHLSNEAASDLGEEAYSGLQQSLWKMAHLVDADMNKSPVITPVMDLSEVKKGVEEINRIVTMADGTTYTEARLSSDRVAAAEDQKKTTWKEATIRKASDTPTINYVQNNYSPKALSRTDIYRDTKNQLATIKKAVKK